MTRGKYGARAANRLVRTDNELLQDRLAEIADLKRQVADRDALIRREQVERDTYIIARGNELSRQLVASATADATKAQEQCDAVKEELAEWLVGHINDLAEANPGVRCVPRDVYKIFARLVGNARVGGYLARIPGFQDNRDARRRTGTDVNADVADNKRPIHARGMGHNGHLVPTQ
jgi:hypothetical protein